MPTPSYGVRLWWHATDLDTDGHLPADQVPIADAGTYLSASEVEAAFQEAMAKLIGHTAHGAMGATETFSALVGSHSGTFDANCTFTFSGGVSGHRDSLLLELTSDGSSVATWPSGGSWLAGSPPTLSTTPGERDFVLILTRDAFATWYGFPQGASGGSGGTPATTVTDETTFGIAPAVGTDTEYARQDHTHGSPTDPTATTRWEVVMTPGLVSPPEPVWTPDGTDWVYAEVPI